MIEKEVAIEVQKHALDAIRSLSDALSACENRCSPEEFEQIKRGVGLSMGRIETELLSVIYRAYPDLDDLS
jgi:hypothetical protein